ncbi:MAG: STAS domain-containing protein [Thermodesulfobacteriota bacterium]|jgi:anti-anti-sigma regulatory factor
MACQIITEGEVTLHNLARFQEQLLSALRDSGEVTLFCKDLTYLDTSAFQLLVALKKSLGNRSLVFQDVPFAILESADLLGLTTFLKLRG